MRPLRLVQVRTTVLPKRLKGTGYLNPCINGDLHHTPCTGSNPAQIRAEQVAQGVHRCKSLGGHVTALVRQNFPRIVHNSVIARRQHQRRLQACLGHRRIPCHWDQNISHVPEVPTCHASRRVACDPHSLQVHVSLQHLKPGDSPGLRKPLQNFPRVPGLIRLGRHHKIHHVQQIVELDTGVVCSNHHKPTRRPMRLLVQGLRAKRRGAVDVQHHRKLSVRNRKISVARARLERDVGGIR
mmetsp:Transcript_42149/g.91853  ORF Transcript_42149/g.91853 Transcript_42149/m.91853 type:complete len:240 (+) Transcript_42149:691-1410(+)